MSKGIAIILGGYIGWGLFPLYWALLTHVAPGEVLLHRMLWSVPVLAALILFSQRRKRYFLQALNNPKELRKLVLSSLLICFNWGIYIWAVTNHRVVEASMGYFLTPLLNVLAGVIVFQETLSKINKLAILFAAIGVAYYILSSNLFPWVGLTVGASFAAYGLMRKQMETTAVAGLFVEILILLPFTLALIGWLHFDQQASFLNVDWNTDLLLIFGGPITILPLVLFTTGTRLLPMTTVGILFYVTPTLQFLSGVIILGETFDVHKLIGFTGIWIGLGIFSYGLLRKRSTGA